MLLGDLFRIPMSFQCSFKEPAKGLSADPKYAESLLRGGDIILFYSAEIYLYCAQEQQGHGKGEEITFVHTHKQSLMTFLNSTPEGVMILT